MKNFITIEGIDGCGKSTLLDFIKHDIENRGYSIESAKEINNMHFHASRSLEELKKLIWPPEDWKSYAHVMPREYWMYLQAAWYTVQSEHFYKPSLKAHKKIITDGWVYKFMAKLAVDGFPSELINSVFSNVAKPDLVVMLDVAPDVIYQRKRGFSAYEKGSMIGDISNDGDSFISYQKQVRSALIKQANLHGWCILSVDQNETPAVTAHRFFQLLKI
ncbi:dTMP kinase [Serratia fonticola]|uniref:dTMP kinase n=1 Tax=Serratia fonticola TaxID=47917 RepID=UPI00217C217B|nr:hypothetical protein [Serratia fonticola]CAI0878463.1 thymidylate kinase [Serratia fonticola]CAI0910896.1 thymidylate kinase [Serratia fonticola]